MRRDHKRAVRGLAILLSFATVFGTAVPARTFAGQEAGTAAVENVPSETVQTLTADNKDHPYVLDEGEEDTSAAEEDSSDETSETAAADPSDGSSEKSSDASDPEADPDIVTVTITSDTGFDASDTASIRRLRSDSQTEKELTASLRDSAEMKDAALEFADGFLIGITDKDGNEFESDGSGQSMTVTLTSSKELLPSEKDTELWHKKADGTWENIPFETVPAGGESDHPSVSFTTTSFSPFLFVTAVKEEAEGSDAGTAENNETPVSEGSDTSAAAKTSAVSTPLKAASDMSGVTDIAGFSAAPYSGGTNQTGSSPVWVYENGTWTETTDSGARYTWTAARPAAGHEFIFRVSYSTSGIGTVPAGTLLIRVPKSLFVDRNGEPADTFDMSVLSEEEYAAAEASDPSVHKNEQDRFTYRVDGDDIVFYNAGEISAATSGYFDVGYILSESTFEYYDMTRSLPFTASVTAGDFTEEKGPEYVYIDTAAKIDSTSKRYPTLYKTWQAQWGTEAMPKDAADYDYLLWEIDTTIDDGITQPYTLSFTDIPSADFGEESVVGFRYSGTTGFVTSSELTAPMTLSGHRYDYVITKHKKTDTEDLDKYKVTNDVSVKLTPADGIDNTQTVKSGKTYQWEKPVFDPGTGSFGSYKTGDREADVPLSYLGQDSAQYSRYDLDTLTNGSVSYLDGLDYGVSVNGYPYPWTLEEGADKNDPANYGKTPVRYVLEDDGVYLEEDGGTASGRPLTSDDFQIDSIAWDVDIKDAYLDDDLAFRTKAASHKAGETLTVELKFGNKDNDYITAGTIDLDTGESHLDAQYASLKTVNGIKTIVLSKDGCVAFRLSTENAWYYTRLNAVPDLRLKGSDYVITAVTKGTASSDDDWESASVRNCSAGTVYSEKKQSDGSYAADTVIYQGEDAASDYIRRVERSSEITKQAAAAKSDKKSKTYTITWRVDADETMTAGTGDTSYVKQKSGTFYDLLPAGMSLDLTSVALSSDGGGTFLDDSSFDIEQIQDYKRSGRTLLIVKVSQPEDKYTLFFNTVIGWDEINDLGRDVYNPVAYETGNSTIASGSANDTSGVFEGDDSSLMTGLPTDRDYSQYPEGSDQTKTFLYADEKYDITAVLTAISGLTKKVRSAEESSYSYDSSTEPDGTYTYRLRFQNSSFTRSKNIVLFDSLENYVKEDGTVSEWRGTLTAVDLTQLTARGISPAVYISTKDGLDVSAENNRDLTDTSVWRKIEDPADAAALAGAKAVAVDVSRKADGSDFILESGESLAAVLEMKAPSSAGSQEKAPETYNNVWLSEKLNDDVGSWIPFSIHNDFTTVRLVVKSNVYLKKADSETNQPVQGITFRLYGTSDYGTAVDKKAMSDVNGRVLFTGIEKGTYILQEYTGIPDYQEDHTEHTVVIDDSGNVYIDGTGENHLVTRKAPLTLTNKPRVHADITLRKRDRYTNALIPDTRFMLYGTSDYGNEIREYAVTNANGILTFGNIEQGTYSLKEVTPNARYTPDDTVYTVQVSSLGTVSCKGATLSADGTVIVTNEPRYFELSFHKEDADTGARLPGAEFTLTGTSDLGTSYNVTEKADGYGTVTFTDIEKGTYLLQETKAPEGYLDTTIRKVVAADYLIDPAQHTVVVKSDGSFTIDGITSENVSEGQTVRYDGPKDGYTITNERAKSGTITVYKIWDDGLGSDPDGMREMPEITISSERPKFGKLVSTISRSKWDASVRPTITGCKTFTEAKGLTLEEVEAKTGAVRIDDHENNGVGGVESDPSCHIYYWTEGTDAYWWSDAEMLYMPSNCASMFDYCGSLTTLDISAFDTSKVTDMSLMFRYCSGLTSLDVSHFDTRNVTSMALMFYYCSGLTSLDLSSFDTSRVTDMSYMFRSCSSLTSLDVSRFDTSNVTNMGGMFHYCSGLTSLDLSNFDTSKVTDMSYMFYYCSSLETLDLSSFDTSKVTDMSFMFFYCGKLATVYASAGFKAASNAPNIFTSCDLLKGGLGSAYSKYGDSAAYARIDGGSSAPGYFTAAASASKGSGAGTSVANLSARAAMAASLKDAVNDAAADPAGTATETYKTSDDPSKWVRSGNVWTYTFAVKDDSVPFYVWESKVPDGYTADFGVSKDGYIEDESHITRTVDKKATVTNSKPGSFGKLSVGKVLADGITSDQSFTFTITLKKADGTSPSGTAVYSGIAFTDGTAKIALSGGETKTLEVPLGYTYTVAEDPVSGWEQVSAAGDAGTVSGTESSAVFTNKKTEPPAVKTGKLTIKKLVDDPQKAEPDGADYTVTVRLTGLTAWYGYTWTNETSGSSESFTADADGNAVVPVSLKKDETVTIDGLTKGAAYQMTEDAGSYYASCQITDGDGNAVDTKTNETNETALATGTETFDPDSPDAVTFTNTYKEQRGLVITKTVTSGPKDASFEFTLSLSGLEPFTSYASSIGRITADDNGKVEKTFHLKDGATVTVSGLPIGAVYNVTESPSAYLASYAVNGADAQSNSEMNKALSTGDRTLTLTDGEATAVAFTNSADTGSFKITKTVDSKNEKDKEKEFSFTVKLANGKDTDKSLAAPVSGTYTLTVANGDAKSESTVTFDSTGKAALTLKDGDEAVISGVPAGSVYTVTEDGAKGFTAYSGKDADSRTEGDSVTGTVGKEGEDVSAASFLNLADLNIDLVKKDAGSGSTLEGASFTLKRWDPEKGFYEEKPEWTAKTDAGGNAYIKDLRTGIYVLTEDASPAGYFLRTARIVYVDAKTGRIRYKDDNDALVTAKTIDPSTMDVWAKAGTKTVDDASYDIYEIDDAELYHLPTSGFSGVSGVSVLLLGAAFMTFLIVGIIRKKEKRSES